MVLKAPEKRWVPLTRTSTWGIKNNLSKEYPGSSRCSSPNLIKNPVNSDNYYSLQDMVMAGLRITEIMEDDDLDTATVLEAIRRGTEQAMVNDFMDLKLEESLPNRNVNLSDNARKLIQIWQK